MAQGTVTTVSPSLTPYPILQGQADEKYVEVDEREKAPHYEQRKWEEEQMSSAVFRFGARDKDKSHDRSQEYELVLDDEIEFIQALRMPGSRTDQDVRLSRFCPMNMWSC
jgi:pre-mRNA-splicing factor ATP-dependent RNA helicase DHX16